MSLASCAATLLALAGTPDVVDADGLLQEVRDEVRRDESDTARNDCHDRPRRHRSRWDEEENENTVMGALLAPVTQMVGAAAFATVTSPFWVPARLVGDDYQSVGRFAHYPHEDDAVGGYMRLRPYEGEGLPWSLHGRTEFGDNFDGVTWIGGNVRWESTIRLGVDTSFDYYQEDLGVAGTDQLWVGDTNVVFRFAQSKRLMMRSGLGVNWLADEVGSDFGFNFTYGGDWFPRQPWVLSSEMDCGWLGDAGLFHARTTAGVNLRNCELFIGFDYRTVGGDDLAGFVTGLRIWY